MPISEFSKAYHHLPKGMSADRQQEGVFNVREFIRSYIISFPDFVRCFPKNNLDIRALEAHLWDRLKSFYRYQSFEEVTVESPNEIKFINEAIKLIEEWFYKGEWTTCLDTPSEEQIAKMLSGQEHGFFERQKKADGPNLGRGRGVRSGQPLSDIYHEVEEGGNLTDIYRRHGYKFLYGPAGTINTLTYLHTQGKISAQDAKFNIFRQAVSEYFPQKLREWGYKRVNPGSGAEDKDVEAVFEADKVLRRMPMYIKPGEEFKRELFFFKTSLIAAELIRRTNLGHLTKESFRDIMVIRQQAINASTNLQDRRHPEMNFALWEAKRASVVRSNSAELPFALFAVDYLKSQQGK